MRKISMKTTKRTLPKRNRDSKSKPLSCLQILVYAALCASACILLGLSVFVWRHSAENSYVNTLENVELMIGIGKGPGKRTRGRTPTNMKPPVSSASHILEPNVEEKTQLTSTIRIIPTTYPTPYPTMEPSITPSKKQQKKGKHKGANSREKRTSGPTLQPTPINWGEQHIQLIPGIKTGIRQDMRVVLPEDSGKQVHLIEGSAKREGETNILGRSRAFVEAQETLKRHPLFSFKKEQTISLEVAMENIKATPQCAVMPIYLSMATVGDDLYWQLIENFVYTMVKFNSSDCSLVICVNDKKCMEMCAESYFPCYNYVHDKQPPPSVMEMIAAVKLYHIPKALARGVDMFMLDLDVGFLADPNSIVKTFYETPRMDIFVQEDMLFIMNRSHWFTYHQKIWNTDRLPNIGLFLCRGNDRTTKVFDIAWTHYLKMEDPYLKAQPGKDQNHVLEGMRYGRAEFGLRYAYLSNDTAPLLDKMTAFFQHHMVELGGEVSQGILEDAHSVAMHTTCYEHVTKVMGLKATNAFWSPRYYDPLRPTITKQILYISEQQVLEEVRSLVWLAMATNRALIIPNLYGSEEINTVQRYKGQAFWPGFRVAHFKRDKGRNALKVDVLEPAFYWRVQRDYADAPEPKILFFNPSKGSLDDVKQAIIAAGTDAAPRIVLQADRPFSPNAVEMNLLDKSNLRGTGGGELPQTVEKRTTQWAKDSVGVYESPFSVELKRYGEIHSVKTVREMPMANEVLQLMRNCKGIFTKHKGNRTCFQICD